MLSNITSLNVDSSIKESSKENKRLDNIENEINVINTEIKNIKEVNTTQSQNISTNKNSIDSLTATVNNDVITKTTGCFDNVKTKNIESDTANFSSLNSTDITANNVKSTCETITILTAGDATIPQVKSDIIKSKDVQANCVDVCDLNATNINTDNFNVDCLRADCLNTDSITAEKATITNANFDSLISTEMSTDKITTKNISTDVATITDAVVANKEYNDTNIVLGKYLTSRLATDYEITTDYFTIIKTGKVFHVIQTTPGYVWSIFDDKDTYTIEFKETGYSAKIRYIGNVPVTNDNYAKSEKTIQFDLLAENKLDVIVTASQTLLGCLSAQITGCICCYDDLWVDNLHSQNYDYITVKDPICTGEITSNSKINVVKDAITSTVIAPNYICFNGKGSLESDSLLVKIDENNYSVLNATSGLDVFNNGKEVILNNSGLTINDDENIITVTTDCASLPETTINGNASVTGDLFVEGTMYCTHAEDLNVNCCTITTRSNATTAMADTEHSGLKVCMGLSDANDLYVVAKNDGQLYIGKEDSLQPIATRTNLTDCCYTKYDATNKTLVNAKDPLANLSTNDLVCYDGNNLAKANQICLAGETSSYSLITPVAIWSSNGNCQSKINPTHICLTDGTNTTYINASQICTGTLTADTINGSIASAKKITDGTATVCAQCDNEINMYPATSGDKTWINYRGGSGRLCIGNGSGSLGDVYVSHLYGTASCANNADYATCSGCAVRAESASTATYATTAGASCNAYCAKLTYNDQYGNNICDCYSKKVSSCNTSATSVYGCTCGSVLYLYSC